MELSLAPGEPGSGAGSWRGAQGGGRKSQGLLAEQTVLRGLCQAAFVLLTRGRQGKGLQRWVEEVHLPHGAPCAVCSGGAVLGPACIFESLLTFFIETSTNPGGILETVAKALSVWHQHARYSALLRRCLETLLRVGQRGSCFGAGVPGSALAVSGISSVSGAARLEHICGLS